MIFIVMGDSHSHGWQSWSAVVSHVMGIVMCDGHSHG